MSSLSFDLTLAQEGDTKAFERLIAPVTRVLQGYIVTLVENADERKDVYQETLVNAWKGIKKFESGCKLTTWLYKIAKNICINRYHARMRRIPSVTIESNLRDNTAKEARWQNIYSITPSDSAAVTELCEIVTESLKKMKPRDRKIFESVVFEGQRYAEVARAHNLNEVTIRSIVFNCRQQIKADYQRKCDLT